MTDPPPEKTTPVGDAAEERAMLLAAATPAASTDSVDEVKYLTQRQLWWRRLRRSKLGMAGGTIVVLLYLSAIFAGFLSPYSPNEQFISHIHAPPQLPKLLHDGGLQRPFVYPTAAQLTEDGLERVYSMDTDAPRPIRFFVRGEESYKFIGLVPTTLRLFGTGEADAPWFPLGTDRMGRCQLSRILHGGRISLTIGLIGVAITTILGTVIGVASGYFGGLTDTVVQRLIELLMSFPAIPLWMALAAALPPDWSSLKVYFGIVTILSVVGWGGLARQVRGLVLATREADYIKAAKSAGATHRHVIFKHLVPSTYGYLIVIATLAIPATILGETALSFLGLGIRPPMTSWGVLLEEAQHVRVIVQFPWLLLPALPVLLTVVAFNFLGDALRDAINQER
ncbi:MAG: ABC transporter permease [Planctomycetota bacterium]